MKGPGDRLVGVQVKGPKLSVGYSVSDMGCSAWRFKALGLRGYGFRTQGFRAQGFTSSQRTQYPLIKEYALNYRGLTVYS